MVLSAFKGAVGYLNAEVKHTDFSVSQTVTSTPTLTLLSGVAQGDTQLTRDGNSIKLVGFYGDMLLSANTTAVSSRCRSLIFIDLQGNGAAPTAANVCDTGVSCTGLINIDTFPGRFVILFDSLETMVSLADSRIKSRRFSFETQSLGSLKDMHIKFGGTGATAASTSGPTLWLMQWSSEVTDGPSTVSDWRILYVDN